MWAPDHHTQCIDRIIFDSKNTIISSLVKTLDYRLEGRE